MDFRKLIGPMAVAAFLGALPLALVYGIEAGAKDADSARSQTRVQQSSLSPVAPALAAPLPLVGPDGVALQARKPIRATPASYIDEYGKDSESLLVKFRDDVAARVADGRVVSLRGRDMRHVEQVMSQRGLDATPLITAIAEDRVRSIGERVTARTGKAGPDYLGLVRFRGERGQVLAAAHAMQALDVVEYVDFEENYEPMEMPWYREMTYDPAKGIHPTLKVWNEGGPAPGNPVGVETDATTSSPFSHGGSTAEANAPTRPSRSGPNFVAEGVSRIDAMERAIQDARAIREARQLLSSREDAGQESGGGIAGDPDFSCGGDDTLACSWVVGTPSCSSLPCCECVCDQHPGCCDEDFGSWSEICVYIAAFSGCPCPFPTTPPWSDVPGGEFLPPPCGAFAEGACDAANGTFGCDNFSCCISVCNADPFCCVVEWDADCAAQALEACSIFNPDFTLAGPTPDLRAAQGYLTQNFYHLDAFIAGLAGAPGKISSVTGAPYLPDIVPTAIAPFFLSDGIFPFSGYWGEGYNVGLLAALGEELANVPGPGLPPGGFDLGPDPGDGALNLAKGLTVKVAVLFPTAFVAQDNVANAADPDDNNPNPFTHEALRHRVTYALPDQTQLLLTNSTTGLLDGHVGTAVLGVIGAGMVENPSAFGGMGGMIGVSPESDLRFYPTSSAELGPGGVGSLGGVFINSLIAAINDLEPGDVISIPYVPRPFASQFSTFAVAFDFITTATVLGINTVVAAGDGCLAPGEAIEVLPQFDEDNDSGVTIVGGVTPGVGIFPPNPIIGFPGDAGTYHRGGHNVTASGSGVSFGVPPNFGPALSRFGDPIHVSGWADSVGAPGFGTIYPGTPADPVNSPFERFYTNRFGGSPAAAAMVAGATANLSGLTKQFFGFPLSPILVRGELATNGTGQPNLGSDVPFQCFGAWDAGEVLLVGSHAWIDPLTGGTIGGLVAFSNLRSAGEWLLINGAFDNCTFQEAVYAIRGHYISGNVPAICAVDGLFFAVRSQGTSFSSKPSFKPPGFEGPLNKVNYRSTGQVADILTVGRVEDPSLITEFGIQVFALPTTVLTIQYIEIYDWHAQRWQFGGFALVPAGAPVCPEAAGEDCVPLETMAPLMFNPQRFFNGDGVALIRTWAYGVGAAPNPGGGFGTGTSDTFDYRVDVVDIAITNVGDVPGGGG